MLKQYKGLRRENYILAFGRLVTGLGSMIWPMMTLILSQKMNIGAKEVSWLLAAGMIIMAPAVYIGGRTADYRDKKMTIVILDLVSVVCYGICALIPMSWTTIILLFIGSLGQNMENPAYNALTADITLTEDRDRAYSLQYLLANLGLVLSPTIAGFLFRNYLWLAFAINSISILCSTVLIFFFVKDTTPVEEVTDKAIYQRGRKGESVLRILGENRIVLLFIAVMSGYYAVYNMYVYLMPLDMAVLHGDAGAIIYGSVTSVNCIVVVLFTPVLTSLFGSRPEPDRTCAGMVLMSTGFLLFFIFEGIIPVYYVSMIILTLGEIFALTSESAYMSRRVPSSHRGQINGAFTVIRTLFSSFFQLVVGFVYGAGGSQITWIFVLIVSFAFTAVAFAGRILDRTEYPNLY